MKNISIKNPYICSWKVMSGSKLMIQMKISFFFYFPHDSCNKTDYSPWESSTHMYPLWSQSVSIYLSIYLYLDISIDTEKCSQCYHRYLRQRRGQRSWETILLAMYQGEVTSMREKLEHGPHTGNLHLSVWHSDLNISDKIRMYQSLFLKVE